MLQIAILGQPCIDEIIAPDGTMRNRSLGGILYSFAAMERAMRTSSREDSFLPFCWNSLPDQNLLAPFYAMLPHMASRPMWQTEEPINRVRLIYSSDADRIEHCASILPALSPNELRTVNLSKLDGIFVNMISGYDCTLETFEWLRAAAPNAHIHLDIHALTLGELSKTIGVGRTPRGIPNWERWLAAADTVQMNELEARWIADPEIVDEAELIERLRLTASESSASRPNALIITRAERGATLFDLGSDAVFEARPEVRDVVETTGSGDVFGSQFIYSYLKTRNLDVALQDAVRLASFNTTLAGVEALVKEI